MLIALGTPRILTERINNEDGGFNHNFKVSNRADLDDDPSIIAIRRNLTRGLFVTISYSSISLWAIKPEVLLSKVVRSSSAISQDGDYVDLVWKPDSSSVAVLTSKGCVHFYYVVHQNTSVHAFNFAAQHHHSMGPGEAAGVPGAYLQLNLSVEVDSGVQCAIGLPEEIIVSTRNPCSFLSFSWDGDVKGAALLSDISFILDANDSITQISCTPDFTMFGFITEHGKAYIATRKIDESSISGNSIWSGTCIYITGPQFAPATTIDFNPAFSLVAVGNLQGVVHVFNLFLPNAALKRGIDASIAYNLAITKPGTKSIPIKLSAVSALSWTSDGYALAVGWVYGGLSVWSVYGCLLTSTVSEDTFVHASDGVVIDTDESFFTGVQDLFWAPADYFLFVLPSPSPTKEIVADIYMLEFGKSSILTSISNQHNSSVCIIASDRLLVYDGIQSDTSTIGLDPLNWQALHIPSMYLASNWPIKYASITPSGSYLGIAGVRGFAHYNFQSERWKFFGNEQQEQAFEVTGLLWYRTLIILSCKNLKTNGYEIRVYSRETKLDDANILHTEYFQTEISAMNLTDLHLLVFCKNCVMQSFQIFIVDGPKIIFQLRQAFSLQEFIGLDKNCVQGVVRLRTSNQTTSEQLFRSPILLLKNGALFLIWKQSNGWLASKLAENVEHFWVAQNPTQNGELQNSIWVFDGKGAKIVNRPTAFIDDSEPRNENVFSMNLDFYPFVVLLEQGVLVGIKQQLSLNKSLEISQFGTEIKTHLFVHLIIQNYLLRGRTSKALAFSKAYEHLDYFNHALEMMLHGALEHDSEKDVSSSDLLLPAAIQFVHQYPRSLEIMVNCARKSEMALWSYFFSIAGDPKTLYQRAFENGSYNVATSYLIIIQTLEPLQVSGQLAVHLLAQCLEAEDYETGSELYRFLRSIYNADHFAKSSSSLNESHEEKALTAEEKSRILSFEILIQQKARSILIESKFREFLKYSSVFSIAVSGFLKQERQHLEGIMLQWDHILLLLHEQFSWPFLDNLPVSSLVKRRDSYDNQIIPWYRRTSLFLQTQQKKIVSKREHELRLFLAACINGELPEMAILLSSMLLDLNQLLHLLQEFPALVQTWEISMAASKKPVYTQLREVVLNGLAFHSVVNKCIKVGMVVEAI